MTLGLARGPVARRRPFGLATVLPLAAVLLFAVAPAALAGPRVAQPKQSQGIEQAPGAEQVEQPQPEPVATFSATALVQERALESATAAVTVIGRSEIEASGAITVAELLSRVPGVHVTAPSRGGSTTLHLRGGDPNFAFVLLDGVPLNDPTDQQGGLANLESLPAWAVERIEVVRGPLSTFLGSSGLSGAVNIVTRGGPGSTATAPAPIETAAEVSAGDGSQRLLAGSVAGPLRVGRDGGIGSGDGNGATGGEASPGGASPAGSYFVGLSWQEQRELIAEESFEQADLFLNLHLPLGGSFLGEGAALAVHGRYADWQSTDYSESSGGPRFGSGELRANDHAEASLGATLSAEGRGGLRHRADLSIYRHQLDRASPAIFPLVPAAEESTTYTRSRLRWAVALPARGDRRLTAGLEAEHERGETRGTLFLPPFFGGPAPSDYRIERTTPGAFAELQSRHGRLDVDAGLRVDAPEGRSAEVSPRLGLAYRLGDGATRLRATVARAFKLPSFFALASPPQLGGNPRLEPESVVGADLGIERSLRAGEASIGLFWDRYRDLVDFDFDLFTHLNRSRVRAQGVESAFSWRPSAHWSVAANVTWQAVEDLDTGDELRNRPRWLAGATASFQPRPDWRFGAELRRLSSRLDAQIPVPERTRAGGYQTLHLTGSWRTAPRWRLSGRVDNLTDEDFEILIGHPGAGRSLRLGLRYRSEG